MSTPTSRLPLVLVEWADATNPSRGWVSLDRVVRATPQLIQAVGFLLATTRTTVALVQMTDHSGQGGNALIIPRGSVQRIQKLRAA